MSPKLNSNKALIFRIVHVDNVPWVLKHGALHCRNWPKQNPNYVNIGNIELIDKRSRRVVPVSPGGTLSDYVPFYFTPYSMMMYKIYTGHGGIQKRENKEIVIFVSSIHRLQELQIPFLFTNQHAYPPDTDFYADAAELDKVDWALLQSRSFKTSDTDPGRQLRYQAEALVHKKIPLDALLGLCCYNDAVKSRLELQLAEHGVKLKIETTPSWYF